MQTLYESHSRPVFRFLLGVTLGDPELAEDLLQETMLRAWRNLDVLPADLSAIRPWLYTVARNIAIDAARAREVRPTETALTDESRIVQPGNMFERLLTAHTVRQALIELTPDHRAVIAEVFFNGSSTAETAERLGIPEGTVKSRTHYALRALNTIISAGQAA